MNSPLERVKIGAGGQSAEGSGPRPADELDEVFALLAHWQRRAVVRELEESGPAELDSLAAAIADERRSAGVEEVTIGLVHNHLPRLADAGVVEYDESVGVCELADASTAKTVLAALPASSSG